MREMLLSRALVVCTALLFGACRAPERPADVQATAPATSTRTAASIAAAPSSVAPPTPLPSAGAPPPVERMCERDEECAVARVEVAGAWACCAACGTTPGTRRWHAELQRYCAAHPPTSCSPLGCPEGPTRAVCREGRCEATAQGADGGPARVPVEQKCLPAMVCDAWSGCALVTGNPQDGWFVTEAERVPRGEIAAVGNVCTVGKRCEAARVSVPGIVCPPWSVPPLIQAPSFTCALEGRTCRAQPAASPPGAPGP